MQFNIISLFPDMFDALKYSIVGRALEQKLINISHTNPRDFTNDPNRTVDDRPYGGGPGMVMKYEPLHAAIESARAQHPKAKVIYLSPQGKPVTQSLMSQCTQQSGFIFVAGRYEGIDERVIEHDIDEEWSVGDYVLSGGELPIMSVIDAITRLLPGALGHEDSADQDSFSEGLLDCPHYTRPETINGLSVPQILLSGDHKAIKEWRLQESLGKTWQKRPDLLKRRILNEQEQRHLEAYIKKGKKNE